ncbi:hypothetical protein D3C86_1483540 [compost metagenome]
MRAVCDALLYGMPTSGWSSLCKWYQEAVTRVAVPRPMATDGATPHRLMRAASRPGMSLLWDIALSRTAACSPTRQLPSTVARTYSALPTPRAPSAKCSSRGVLLWILIVPPAPPRPS